MNQRESNGNAIVVDTNVLIHDPGSIHRLRQGENTLIIPFTVVLELDKLKNKPEIGYDARDALRQIEEAQLNGDRSVIIQRNAGFKNLNMLDKSNPDHQIVATAVGFKRTEGKHYKSVKMISIDRTVRMLARWADNSLAIEDYKGDRVDKRNEQKKIAQVQVPRKAINEQDFTFDASSVKSSHAFLENEGVICYSDYNPASDWRPSFVAIKKGDTFQGVETDVKAMGLTPLSKKDEPNWEQFIALGQLLDKDIKLVFLEGGAGTGKTLLAVASALHMRKYYRQIFVTRPMVHLEDQDNVGFLKGDLNAKVAPWRRPIDQALRFLKQVEKTRNAKVIEDALKHEKVVFETLDYIRGTTFHRSLLIIDEAQNLTPHQMKTIISRAGEGTKLIFTGDPTQVDRKKRLDSRSNGFTYAIERLKGQPIVSVCNFKQTVRSPLAELAVKYL